MRVFISYASENIDIAEKICEFLEKDGKTCWIAPRDISAGKEYGEEIVKGIDNSDAFVLLFSTFSNHSQHVLREVERAVCKNIPIISYKIDSSALTKSLEYFLNTTQWLDATKFSANSLQQLGKSLDRLFVDEIITENTDTKPIITKKQLWIDRNKFAIILGAIAVGVFTIAAILLINGSGRNGDKDKDAISKAATDDTLMNADESLDTKDKAADDSEADGHIDVVEADIELTQEDSTDTDKTFDSNSSQGGTEQEGNLDASINNQDNTDVSVTEDSNNSDLQADDSINKDDQSSEGTTDGDNKADGNGQTGSTGDDNSNPTSDKDIEAVNNGNVGSNVDLSMFEEGNYISFGRYYPTGYKEENKDGEISWVIVGKDEKSGELTLVSEYILDIMPYDTAESGIFDKDKEGNSYNRELIDTYTPEKLIEFRGNNDWEKSNIRSWLNTNKAVVKYVDSAPVDRGSDEYCNGYNTRSGFLHNFTDKELAMIQEKEIQTPVSIMDNADATEGFALANGKMSDITDVKGVIYKTTKDRVFLLSIYEVKEYFDKGVLMPYTRPTISAAASDNSPWLNFFTSGGKSNYIWATRTPLSTYPHFVMVVGTGNNTYEFNSYWAAISGHGIRPAMVIKPAHIEITGEGTSSDPFVLMME